MQGGIKAVVWTDFFQSFVMILAFVAVIIVVSIRLILVYCVLKSYHMNTCAQSLYSIFVSRAF